MAKPNTDAPLATKIGYLSENVSILAGQAAESASMLIASHAKSGKLPKFGHEILENLLNVVENLKNPPHILVPGGKKLISWLRKCLKGGKSLIFQDPRLKVEFLPPGFGGKPGSLGIWEGGPLEKEWYAPIWIEPDGILVHNHGLKISLGSWVQKFAYDPVLFLHEEKERTKWCSICHSGTELAHDSCMTPFLFTPWASCEAPSPTNIFIPKEKLGDGEFTVSVFADIATGDGKSIAGVHTFQSKLMGGSDGFNLVVDPTDAFGNPVAVTNLKVEIKAKKAVQISEPSKPFMFTFLQPGGTIIPLPVPSPSVKVTALSQIAKELGVPSGTAPKAWKPNCTICADSKKIVSAEGRFVSCQCAEAAHA